MTEPPDLFRLAERVGRKLLTRGTRVVAAESCTGGWIAKALTDVPGSSQWFAEGYVAQQSRQAARPQGDGGDVEEAWCRQSGSGEGNGPGALERTGAVFPWP